MGLTEEQARPSMGCAPCALGLTAKQGLEQKQSRGQNRPITFFLLRQTMEGQSITPIPIWASPPVAFHASILVVKGA